MSNTMIDQETLTQYADEIQGNWSRWDSFCWFGRPNDAELWGMVYLSNRDTCDALTLSNAKVIQDVLAADEFQDDVVFESHSHFACGHVDGFSIRVRTAANEITPAFKAYAELLARMEDYPVLDESLMSEMECQDAEESWDNYGRYDFKRALIKQLRIELAESTEETRDIIDTIDDVWTDEQIDEARESIADHLNWESFQESSGTVFNIDGMVRLWIDSNYE